MKASLRVCVSVGTILGTVDIDGRFGVVSIVTNKIQLIRSQNYVLEYWKWIGKFPVYFSFRKRSGDNQTFIISLISFSWNCNTSSLILVEKYLLDVGLNSSVADQCQWGAFEKRSNGPRSWWWNNLLQTIFFVITLSILPNLGVLKSVYA